MQSWFWEAFPLSGQAVFDWEHQQLSVVSRAPGNLDVFVIGYDKKIWTTYWNDQSGWAPEPFPLPGQAVFDWEHQRSGAGRAGAGIWTPLSPAMTRRSGRPTGMTRAGGHLNRSRFPGKRSSTGSIRGRGRVARGRESGRLCHRL